MKSLQPWPQLWPNAWTLQPAALAAATESPTQHGQRVRLPQSSAVKLLAQAVATFKRRATRSSCSAWLARAMKSLQPWPEPRPCSRQNRYSQPSTPRRPAQASSTLRRKRPRLLVKRCEAAKQRVVFARSSASLITRPARVQIKTLNPKRFVSGRYWGGLKQPPRRAAPRPSGSRRAASRANPKSSFQWRFKP